jgi:hypothetical protein
VISFVNAFVLPAALALLPPRMDSPAARALLLAIGLQESEFLERRQLLNDGRIGRGRGFWQFELGGAITGVLSHPSTRAHVRRVLEELRYDDPSPEACYAAVEHNDVLAAAFARLNLWWLPGRLPRIDEANRAWVDYLEAWRPGKPREATWDANYARAWRLITAETS